MDAMNQPTARGDGDAPDHAADPHHAHDHATDDRHAQAHDAQDHAHAHDHHREHAHDHGWLGWLRELLPFGHRHSHGDVNLDSALEGSARGIWALKVSLV